MNHNFGALQKKTLKSVSRSFYLSFCVLPKAIRPIMSLGYLLCRAADTIADFPSISLEERLKTLGQFKKLFSTFPIPEENLKEFARDLVDANMAPKTNEGKLLARFEDCAVWFNSLSKTDQSLIQNVVLAVIKGMEMDLKTFGDSAETLHAFSTKTDLETYIHWIGGEPGRFWTNVCLAHLPNLNIQNRAQWLKDGIVFGTGLQMVNILRDLPSDLKNGRCYIPAELLKERGLSPRDIAEGKNQEVFFTIYNDLIDQTQLRLERGFSYINQMQKAPLGVKMAARLPMMIGLKTLDRLRRTSSIFQASEPVKVKRWEVYWLVLSGVVTLSPFCIGRRIRRVAHSR